MERGVVVRYDEAKGFGFVRCPAYGSKDVFVHASAIVGGVPLRPGQRVRFSAEESNQGPRAVRVEPGRAGLSPALAGAVGIGAGLVGLTIALAYARLPIAWAWVASASAAAFALYALDKHRAGRDRRRVPEAVLLGSALIGGTPGAAAAMLLLRHKTRKPKFLAAFAAVVVIQAAALAWWAAS